MLHVSLFEVSLKSVSACIWYTAGYIACLVRVTIKEKEEKGSCILVSEVR